MTQPALPPPQEPARAALPLGREIALLLERALNREIAASTAAADVLADLDGKAFAVEVLGLGVRCVLEARGGHVGVTAEALSSAAATGGARPAPEVRAPATRTAATLRATPFDLLKLARASDLSSL